MAKVLLTSAYDPESGQIKRMRAVAETCTRGAHVLTDDPAAADLILFVETDEGDPFYSATVKHPFTRRYPDKSFLFTRVDLPLPVMQGVYLSLPAKGHHRQWTRSGAYLKAAPWDEPLAEAQDPLLFSFLGDASNHPVRQRILTFDGNDAVVEDTSSVDRARMSPEEWERYTARYVEVSQRSLFVLAPRGKGNSSMRLFEAMRMGRPPVILADSWVAPDGPDWERFSVRVPENEVMRLPEILEARRDAAVEMGRLARAAWERWFSERAFFDTVVTACEAIAESRVLPAPLLRALTLSGVVRARHVWGYVRQLRAA